MSAPVTVLAALRTFVYVTLFMLFFGSLALSVRGFDGRLGVELPGWTTAPGAVLMGAGAAVALTCAALFVARGGGTPAPFDPPRVFVPSGPYRHVRNPMYVGGLALLLGFGLLLRSASIVLLAFFLFLVLHLFVVLVEEPGLERRFGESYFAYKASTNRWIPSRRRTS